MEEFVEMKIEQEEESLIPITNIGTEVVDEPV